MPLGTDVDVATGDFVFDGDPTPPAKGAEQTLLFSAHIYCGGHGRPSQLLLSSCYRWNQIKVIHLARELRTRNIPQIFCDVGRGLTARQITLTSVSRRQPVTIDY